MDLSTATRQRLRWLDYYEKQGRNGRLTCRYFGISPQTFYRWKGRYDPQDLRSLEERSRRPQQVRPSYYNPSPSPKSSRGALLLQEGHESEQPPT